MKKTLFFFTLLISTFSAIIRTYIDDKGQDIDHHIDSYFAKGNNGALYRVSYDAEIPRGSFITNLDVLSGINKVTCDMKYNEMVVEFNSVPEAYILYDKLRDEGYRKYIITVKYNCDKNSPANIKEVLSVEINQNLVFIKIDVVTYDNLFKQAKVRVDQVEKSCFEVKASLIGNVPSSLYKNDDTECDIGTKEGMAFNFEIEEFKLKYVSIRFKNIELNEAFAIDMKTKGETYEGTLLQVNIGAVPILLTYQIPIRALIDSASEHKVSTTWQLGDVVVEWDEYEGWKKSYSDPSFRWNHNPSDSLQGEDFPFIASSMKLHLMNMIDIELRFTPDIRIKEAELRPNVIYKAFVDLHASINTKSDNKEFDSVN